MPLPLAAYRRDFTPDLEVKPREPVFAVDLTSPKGVPFTLVREAVLREEGGDLAWLLWAGEACVGYVGGNVVTRRWDPFDGRHEPYRTRRQLQAWRSVAIWRSFLADGTGLGTGADVLARLPMRGQGVMFAAYVEIIRQLSVVGWALRSNPKARSPDAKKLWQRLAATPGIEIVRSRAATSDVRELAFILEAALPDFARPLGAVSKG